MDLGLKGKTVLVTGAGAGIGKSTALAFASEGANVALGDINGHSLAVVEGEVAGIGVETMSTVFDVADDRACLKAFDEVRQALGPVDILINNAGICPFRAIEEISSDEWDRVMQVNLKGAFLLSRAVIPQMKARRWGRIVNVSSMAGKVGGLAASAHYAASKAGLICLTKSLARLGASDGVTVNAVAPAFIRTPLFTDEELEERAATIPVGRPGEPEDVATAVLFLSSELTGFITGEVLDINGGMLMD